MGNSVDRVPSWSERALQGLAFWIGHRHVLFPNYPLGESAIVAESCNLIFAHLGSNENLLCETQYSRLMSKGKWPPKLGKKARADLIVVSGLTRSEAKAKKQLSRNLLAVIEVKRASAQKSQIHQDLERLAVFKRENPKARALLFVVSEAHRPKQFVTPQGKAAPGKTEISEQNAHYRVRRACKAAVSFGGTEFAHYACIIEVLLN